MNIDDKLKANSLYGATGRNDFPFMRKRSFGEMTVDEKKELDELIGFNYTENGLDLESNCYGYEITFKYMLEIVQWIESHNFEIK